MCESKVLGFCSVSRLLCDGSGDVCRLHPENGVATEYNYANPQVPYVVRNESCSNFFKSEAAYEASKVSSFVAPMAFAMEPVGSSVGVNIDGRLQVYSVEDDKLYKDYLLSLGDFVEPEVDDVFAFASLRESALGNLPVYTVESHGMMLVGTGEKTSENCRRFIGFKVCLDHKAHEHVTLDGKNFSGKGFVRKTHAHCNRVGCRVCFRSGWALQESERIRQKIAEASKTRGLAEHIIVSCPVKDYDLPVEKLRANAAKALYARGIVGGCMVWHGFRYRRFDVIRGGIRNMRGYYWAPHFHVIGFLLKSYAKCRGCTKAVRSYVTGGGKTVKSIGNDLVCRGCDGFEALTRKIGFGDFDIQTGLRCGVYADSKGKKHKADGFIVKVMGERQTIKGTAMYQLNHAATKIGVEDFRVVTWFGNCSTRKLKVTIVKVKQLCPICAGELKRGKYVGTKLLAQVGFFGKADLIVDVIEADPVNGGECVAWEEAGELPKWG